MLAKIISISIATAILWICYRVLFVNSNRLVFNRMYLLTALLFSLLLPSIGIFLGNNVPQLLIMRDSLFGSIVIDEITITADSSSLVLPLTDSSGHSTISEFSFWIILGLIYIIGVVVSSVIFLFKLGKLWFIIIKSPKQKMNGYTVVFTGRDQGSFSFFNYAFFPDENVAPEIIQHELSHIRHHHSYDILFVELMMILQWFNPFIYLYKRDLQSLHEYMADHDVVATGVDKKNYMMLILQQCTAADFSGMSNNFSLLLTKKRIKMITQNKKTKGVIVKALMTLPVFAFLVLANCKLNGQEASLTTFKISDGTYLSFSDPLQIDIDGELITLDLNDIKNDTDFMIGGHKITAQNNHDENNSFSVTIDGAAFNLDMIKKLLSDDENKSPQGEDQIYMSVEEFPEFPGGTNAMMNFIANNLKYPESAKNNHQEGRVFVSFVVEKDGGITDVKVMRGVCEDIDAESIRVVKSMPKWKPGKQDGKAVRVQYTLPIVFKLSGGK